MAWRIAVMNFWMRFVCWTLYNFVGYLIVAMCIYFALFSIFFEGANTNLSVSYFIFVFALASLYRGYCSASSFQDSVFDELEKDYLCGKISKNRFEEAYLILHKRMVEKRQYKSFKQEQIKQGKEEDTFCSRALFIKELKESLEITK